VTKESIFEKNKGGSDWDGNYGANMNQIEILKSFQ
jgi:hypothetical protein